MAATDAARDEEPDPGSRAALLTVGHGTLDQGALAELLRTAGVGRLVDVRRYPGSRRHPHVASEAMARWLPDAGIAYEWVPELGGRRRPSADSPNVGLRNRQFRAYADHMASDEFATGLARLLGPLAGAGDGPGAAAGRTAVMCSETVWWRCHRRLLADHLVLLDEVPVEHLFHDGRTQPHPATPEARAVDGEVRYLAPEG